MLNNPNWTKPEPLSIDGVIAWLEKQPAEGTYIFCDRSRCLARQYNDSIGREYPSPLDEDKGSWTPFDRMLETIGRGGSLGMSFHYREHTFGKALERAILMRMKEKENA